MVFLNLGTAEPGHFERSSQKYPGFERATCRVRKSRTAAVVTWFLGGRSRSHVATPMGELAANGRARGKACPRPLWPPRSERKRGLRSQRATEEDAQELRFSPTLRSLFLCDESRRVASYCIPRLGLFVLSTHCVTTVLNKPTS